MESRLPQEATKVGKQVENEESSLWATAVLANLTVSLQFQRRVSDAWDNSRQAGMALKQGLRVHN